MAHLISQNKDGIIHVESDSGEVFGIVSQTEILDSNFVKLEGDTLSVLEQAGFELEQDWESESTYIEFREENGETSRVVFSCGAVEIVDATEKED